MDSKPFLGGKYVGPVQVTTGEVETFTAREAGSDRPVYVHQISGTALPAQAALLKLLLSCLYRSPTVKEHVLDVREEGDVCYVVTQSAPQCLLLGEWLQFESERSDPGIKPVRAPTKPEEPRRKPDESPAVIAPPIPAGDPAVRRAAAGADIIASATAPCAVSSIGSRTGNSRSETSSPAVASCACSGRVHAPVPGRGTEFATKE